MNGNGMCAMIALTFFISGFTGIIMAVYVSVYGYVELSHSAPIELTEAIVRHIHDYN